MRTVFLTLLAVVGSVASAGVEAPLYLEHVTSIYHYAQEIFVMPVLVGNPKKAFNLTLDMDFYRTGLIGTSSLTPACSKDGARRGFDPAHSTTFRRANSSVEWVQLQAYMKGNQCRVVVETEAIVGRDDFLGVKNVPFQVVTNYTGGWNVQWASDGFLGLQAPSGYDDPPNAVNALMKNTGGEPIVGIVLNGKRSASAEVGKIAFGRVPRACGSVKYAPKYWNYTGAPWNVLVTKASLGNASSTGNEIGQIYLAEPVVAYLDTWVLADFMGEIGAEVDSRLGRYVIDCGRAAGLPSLNVHLGDVELSFSYKDYVDLASNNSGKCTILLTSNYGGASSWTFGNRLFQRYCVTFNYETGAMGFAEIQR